MPTFILIKNVCQKKKIIPAYAVTNTPNTSPSSKYLHNKSPFINENNEDVSAEIGGGK